MSNNKSSAEVRFDEVRRKRIAVSLPALRAMVREGRSTGTTRALVRLDRGTTEVLIGLDDVKNWDDEELRRGRRRDDNGEFHGRRPQVVAKAVHDEMVRRTLDEANKLLTENLNEAVKILIDIAKDGKADNKDRLTAVKMITDRAMGKEPMTINVGQEKKWQAAITHSIVSMPAALVDPDIKDEGEEDGDPAGD